jgi:hypothetical protein
MFSVSEDSLRQSRCVFILRVSSTVSQCRNKRKSQAVAVLVAVCFGKGMIYARAYCFQKCVGNERRKFKHRRGPEPGPTGLSILLSWRVTANYSAYFEICCLILLVFQEPASMHGLVGMKIQAVSQDIGVVEETSRGNLHLGC